MKKIIYNIYKTLISFIIISFFSFQAIAGVHFAESFTSPNFPTTSTTTGSYTLSSGAWDAMVVTGLETINAYNGTGQAVKLARYVESFITTPAVNNAGSISFYYRNFASMLGGGIFIVQKSVNNGAFTDLATVSFTAATSYTLFSLTVNDASSNVRFRIYCPVDVNPGMLCIDEIVVTDIGQTLTTTPTTLESLNYFTGLGPSTSKYFNLMGSNLTGYPGNIAVTAPTNYEISLDNVTFIDYLDVYFGSSTLAATKIYVRLKAGLANNSYNLEDITIDGGGVSIFSVKCSGNVTDKPIPSISLNKTSLSGFSYVFGSGPSVAQGYSFSVTNLNDYPGNVVLTAPSSFEISLDYATYSNTLSVPYTSGTLATTNVYVRQKSGLSPNSYSENVTNEVEGASVTVQCSGTVTAPPASTLSLSTSTLTGFSYFLGAGPSISQIYTLNGSNLTGFPSNISIIAPTNYELSTDNVSYSSGLNIPYTSSTLSSTTIYVRLKAGLLEGAFNSEIITNSGGGAGSLSVTCYGNVTNPPTPIISLNVSNLSGFTYPEGNGPSSEKMFDLSGTNLSGFPSNITITAPINYEVSLSSGAGFGSSVNVPYTSETMSWTTIYVRLKSSLSMGSYNTQVINIAGAGAASVTVTCNGTVTSPPVPTISLSVSTLSNFSYVFGSGPSTSKNYTLTGTYLTGYPSNIVVTAPTNYEVSTNNSTFTASVNVYYASESITSTIYVRLKAGLTVATYNSALITNAGGGSSTVNVTCNGDVLSVPPPALALNTLSLTGFAYTVGVGPSTSKNYSLSGTYLTGYPSNVTVTAPTNYEVSKDNSTFSTSVLVPYTSSTLSSTTIYVRLKAGLAIASYNSENISNSVSGATTLNVSCSGSVNDVYTGPCLSENFSSFTNVGTADISTSLDTYTQSPGWTGLKVYTNSGAAKLGSSSALGYVITPATDLSAGGTLTFDIQKYSTDAGLVQVLHASNGTTFVQLGTDITPTASYSTQTVVIPSGTVNSKIKIATTAKRVYLDNVSITCGGSVATSTLSLSATTLTGFTYVSGSGPSASQTYNLSGSNLTGFPSNITVTAPTNYEVSTNNSTFASSLTVAYTSATLSSTAIYVRLKSTLVVGNYNSELVTNAGGGASNVNVTCSGSVTAAPSPTLSLSATTLTGFTYVTGSGPSTSQTYNLSGSNLTGFPSNITVTAPTNYEVSTNNSTFASSVTVAYSSAILSSTAIYVRLKSTLVVGTYNSELVTNAGGGASTVNVTCSGSVTSLPSPTLTLSSSTLSGFTYIAGSGPSASQTYNLSGSYLTGYPSNITISAPPNYEVSTNNSTFALSVTVAYSSATLSSTPIYVRLKSALLVGIYNSELVSNAGGGATTVNVTCNGSVTDVSSVCLSESFDAGTTDPTGWANNSAYYNTTAARTGNGAGMNAVADWIRTTVVTNPQTLTFWAKASSATANYTVTLQTSTDNITYTDNATFIANGSNTGDVTSVYSQLSVSLNLTGAYYIRWNITARTGGSFYFDDVEVTCGTSTNIETPILENELSIYPNPNNGSFTISNSDVVSKVEIYDICGKLIYGGSNIENNQININTKPGVYLLFVYSENSIKSTKILIK